ncbi:protein PRRC2C isoform X2 [Orussus abietinus]|nr:protein PRRC2C isoform X2 [Orussus abietinus]
MFYGVVCEICNFIVKPQALIQHMESRHPSGTVNLPPPQNPVVKPPVKTPYCKVSKLKKTTSMPILPSTSKVNNTAIKRTTDQANLQPILSLSSPHSPLEPIPVQSTNSTTVVSSSPVKSPGSSGQPRRKRLKTDRSLLKDREYDPDRHCGVWNEETGKPCTRSLTCKAHTVSLRRTVSGRSKSFDKLLAEHRAAKELPNRPTKVTVTGTVTVSSNLNLIAPNTPVSNSEAEVPSSPPVLSLPDTYPLPKAVDLLYRYLAPHGSTKPTKLEEDFANEELSLESSLANSASASSSLMAPISVVLPSLSPIPTNSEEAQVATLIPAAASPGVPVVPTPVPASQPVATALEGETPADVEAEPIALYSPASLYKENKSQVVAQIPRANHVAQSPTARTYQAQASMPSLGMFDPVDQLDHANSQLANGKRINNSHIGHASPVGRPKRSKHEFQQEFPTAIQVEATTTSTPYSHFGDISWSNCHPEPLAVSRWLRITSSRKQYNFNIH